MAALISFTIPGRLRGKGRHRARAMSVKGKTFVQTYPDAKTVSAEKLVRDYAAEAMNGHGLLDGPVELCISIFQRTPKSWSKKKAGATRWITTRPDWDNVGKLISDAMNRVVYEDDSQVARVTVERKYSTTPEHVHVSVQSLTEAA